MKTLHIFHHSNLKNGVDKTTCTLIAALKKIGVTPYAVVPEAGDVTDYLKAQQIDYSIIPYSCCTSSAERAQLRFFAESFAQQEALSTLIQNESPDVIHINTGHLLYAGLAAAKYQIPAIWHIHSPFEEDLTRYQSSIGQGGYIWLLEKLSSQIIGVSDDVSQSLIEYLPQSRINTVYNGINIDELELSSRLTSTDIRQELGISNNAKLVIGIGRISAQKNFASFARIAGMVSAQKSDVYFIIVGPKQEKEAFTLLENEIRRLQLTERLFVLGPRNDVPALITQSSLFLSTAIFEGQGLAALETMALRKPVVAMACQGLRECINHEKDGLLIDLGDEACASQAILRLLNDDEYAHKLAINGHISVSEIFSSEQYAQQFIGVAEKAITVGSATITSSESMIMQGLLKEINYAHEYICKMDNLSLIQRIRIEIWRLFAIINNKLNILKKKIKHLAP